MIITDLVVQDAHHFKVELQNKESRTTNESERGYERTTYKSDQNQ